MRAWPSALETDRIADAEVVEAINDFTDVWDAMTYKERTLVVRAVVELVEYDGTDVTITFREDTPRA